MLTPIANSAFVLCNGEPPSRTLVRRIAGQCDLFLAADGGANTAKRYRMQPDIIIGDLDSVTPATLKAFSSRMVLHVARQDNTDLEKALDFLAARKVGQVFIAGATGGRIDFTLGNLAVIWNYVAFMRLTILGDGWYARPVQGSMMFSAPRGTVASILPFTSCSGVTISGLRYRLRDASMDVGEVGVSNVVTASSSSVSVRRGKLLLIVFAPYGEGVRPAP